jgi:hypothetical protein
LSRGKAALRKSISASIPCAEYTIYAVVFIGALAVLYLRINALTGSRANVRRAAQRWDSSFGVGDFTF